MLAMVIFYRKEGFEIPLRIQGVATLCTVSPGPAKNHTTLGGGSVFLRKEFFHAESSDIEWVDIFRALEVLQAKFYQQVLN